MSVFSNLEDLDNQLTQRSQNVREIIELRKKIIQSVDPAQKNLLDFIDIAYLENDLSSQAYIRERKALVESYHDPVKAGPIDEFRYKSLEQDLGYLDNVISAEQYVERKNHLLKEFADKVSSERIQNVDRKFLNEALSPEEYLEQKRSILDRLYGLKATVIPDARNVVISQRLLFLITIIFGVYFIILPQSNYYSKINTVVYFVVIGSGLYGYFFRNNPKSDYEPYVSVIIPVYNGEKEIYNVIKSHVETDYPHDKLEILIANDGSKDRTVNEVRRAIMDFPNVYIRHLRYKKNGGKRQVIRKAFDESTGEVIVRCDADTYLDNAAAYREELNELDGWIRDQVALIPLENRELVTDHMVFGYFVEEYGFTQIGAVIPAQTTEAETSGQQLAYLIDIIQEEEVKAIFVGVDFDPTLSQIVAEDTGVDLVPLHFGSLSAGTPAGTYLTFMRHNVKTIVNALQ